jgi:hypothetical protein
METTRQWDNAHSDYKSRQSLAKPRHYEALNHIPLRLGATLDLSSDRKFGPEPGE